ncbi:MAG TPA: hypothetical protein VGF31_00580, partial [Myxococcaceae bacterium]
SPASPGPVSGEEQPVPSDLDAEVRRVKATALFLITSLDETLAAVRALHASGATLDPDVLAVLTLPTPWARGWDVLFLAERRGGGVSVLYEGRHPEAESRSFQRLDDPRPLVGIEVEAWAARQLAADRYLRNGTCHGGFQALVLPPHEGEDGFTVYILPTPGKRLAIGGFRRIRVSADGQRVLSDEPLTEGCRSAADTEPIRIHNAVVEVPDEMSLMLAIGLPRTFEVVTRRGRWDITSGRMRYLGAAAP